MSTTGEAVEIPQKRRIDWGRLLCLVVLLLVLFIILFPVYTMFKNSVADKASIVTGGRYPEPLWPFEPSLQQYEVLFAKKDFLASGGYSLQIALMTVALSLLIGAPAAFALARYKFPGLGVLLFLIISIRIFPDISSVIPVTERFLRPPFVYIPTVLQVVMAHTLLSLPYVVYICQGVFEAIPKDLEEQAQILGASKLYAFVHVIVPVSLPGMAAAAIYTFLLSWNEFIFSYYLLFQSSFTTLPVYMMRLLSWTPQRNFLAALAVILSLPVIIFTFLIQRYMIAGMTAGAVK